MSKEDRYTDEPIEAEVIPDFLPRPDQIVPANEPPPAEADGE